MIKVKVDFNIIIQFLGMSGIIGSLIFVALEIIQTQKIAIAGQQQGRAALGMKIIEGYSLNNVDFQSVFFQLDNDKALTLQEITHRNSIHAVWFLFENDLYQHQLGLMDENTWQAKINGMQWIYNKCDLRPLFDAREKQFSAAFRELVKSFPDECSLVEQDDTRL